MSLLRLGKKDSKVRSLTESAFDIFTGYVMYIPVNYFVLPLFIDTIQLRSKQNWFVDLYVETKLKMLQPLLA